MCFDCFKMHPKCKAECCACTTPIPSDIYRNNLDKRIEIPTDELETPSPDNKEIFTSDTDILAMTDSGNCTFLNKDLSCNIYKDRPPICRKFGDESHPGLSCCWINKDGKERPRAERRRIEKDQYKFSEMLVKLGASLQS